MPIRSTLKDILEMEGHAVSLAEDGAKGVEAFAAEKPDLVLTDIKMPAMDGMEVLAKIMETRPDCPVIMISGHGDIDTAVCSVRTPVTTAFLDQIRRVCPPGERNRFMFRLLWHAAVLFLRYLRDMHAKIEDLEDSLHESISNEVLLKLLTYQKSLVYFSTSLKADNILINRLDHARQLNLSEDDSDVLDDAAVEYQQALETATIHANILNGTLDTFASLINNNLSNVMKDRKSVV